jgi:hypothetical protein
VIWRGSGSVHGIGHKTPAEDDTTYDVNTIDFTDTAYHWAADAIHFSTARGYMSGTGEAEFSPHQTITRADFAEALANLAGVDVSGYSTVTFKDIKPDDPALPYIAWAAENGIINGYSSNQFKPNETITREEMAGMWQAYADAIGYTLPVSRAAVKYDDDNKLTAKLRDAVVAVRQAGIMSGMVNNQFDPKLTVSRAEAALYIHRFAKLTTNAYTSRGWVENDGCQRQYIDANGKAYTGWKTIEGNKYFFDKDGVMKTGWYKESGKTYFLEPDGMMAAGRWVQINDNWYYFYADGKMAVNTVVDGFRIDLNGVKEEEDETDITE